MPFMELSHILICVTSLESCLKWLQLESVYEKIPEQKCRFNLELY